MNRNKNLNILNNTELWDLLVIGGGATGLGAALDAASRGMKVLLIEKHDFSKGTNKKSTKPPHSLRAHTDHIRMRKPPNNKYRIDMY